MTKLKKLTLLLASAAFALIVSPIYAQVPQGTTSVTFDNFCDGATITVTGDLVYGTHDNWDCNGSQTWVNGVVATDILLAPRPVPDSRVNVSDNSELLTNGCPLNLYLDFINNEVAAYSSCDGTSPETLINKTTFTIVSQGTRATPRGGVALSQVRYQGVDADSQGSVPDIWGPKGNFTVSWDGYCDFMVLNSKGTKIGGTHDLLTNCALVDGDVAGNNANLPADASGTAGKGGILQSNIEPLLGLEATLNYYTNWSAGTWCNYYAFDTVSGQFLNFCGTFTLTQGAAIPATRGLPPSVSIRR